MEILDLNWFRLVLDGPSQRFYLWMFSLPVLGIPILVGTVAAVLMDRMRVRTCALTIAAVLVLWFVTLYLL